MGSLYAAAGDAFARIEQQDKTGASRSHSGPRRIAHDPHQPATVSAATKLNGLWRRRDGGEHWEDAELPLPNVYSVAVIADGAI